MQEGLDSYEETMCNNRGSGKRRVPTEFSEIGRINSSMAEFVGISRNKVLLQGSVGSVVPHSYGRSQGNRLEDASITDPTIRGQRTRNRLPSDEVGALHDGELSTRMWVPTSGAR